MTPYYEDDHVTIYHGDCREIDAWDIAGGVMVTDPPYGIAHSSNRPGAPRRGQSIAGDESVAVRDDVIARWVPRPAIVFGTCRQAAPAMDVRATLVWDKGGHVGMGDLALPWKQNWEHIYVGGPGFAGRRGTGVLRYNAVPPWAGLLTHPHEKPVDLLRELIGKCPPLCDVVDPFMGSGATLRAAKDLGRRAIGIEIEERYCEIAAKRMAQEVLPL
jgi:DNA modification methylase